MRPLTPSEVGAGSAVLAEAFSRLNHGAFTSNEARELLQQSELLGNLPLRLQAVRLNAEQVRAHVSE